MEETISLKELFSTIRKRLNLIVMITACAVLVSAIVSYFVLTPIYQSSTQLLVNQSKNKETLYNYNEVQTNLQLINTYSVIIKSPVILELVKDELDLEMKIEELNNSITVSSEKDSQVLNISVENENPKQAVVIANKTAEVFKKEIVNIMNVDNVKILASASLDGEMAPLNPKPLLNIAIAFVLGLMVSVGVSFLLEYLDNTIKNEQDVEKQLGLPVLGAITIIDASSEMKARTNRNKQKKKGDTYAT